MDTTASSSLVTIDITLIWSVIGSLVTVIGVMGRIIYYLYKQVQKNQETFSNTILTNTTQLITVTKDNSDSNRALQESVKSLPDTLFAMIEKATRK